MRDGFIRVAAGTPAIRVADCGYNARQAAALAAEAWEKGAHLLVLPELCLTGYTCGDLFLQPTLLAGARQALLDLGEMTKGYQMLVVAGLPVEKDGSLFNCAAVLCAGRLLGLVPKTHLPTYGEFYEARHFTPAPPENTTLPLSGEAVPFGTGLLFCCAEMPGFVLGVEICEDLWSSEPPSAQCAAAGATVVANLSASNETVGKAGYRRALVTGQSARLICGYVYANAGEGESTTDLVFAGHNLVAENGVPLAEGAPFSTGLTYSELDLARLLGERRRITTFPARARRGFLRVPFSLPLRQTPLSRAFSPTPFIPQEPGARAACCEEILSIQAHGLKKRVEHTGCGALVVGVSGGLDSALALLVCARALDLLGRPRTDILGVTMPCFGTSGRTLGNARRLCGALGVALREIPLAAAVGQHLNDIGHARDVHDTAYENAQARERTQVLMDLANSARGLVVGTGDLSELALGWATYNGDHMSMYGVNASVPKTLVRHLVRHEAGRAGGGALAAVLGDILDTPVSPELLPAGEGGEISQKTEDIVGPYELHDFFLYYGVRWAFPPAKVLRLACAAFAGQVGRDTLLHWLGVFYRRFFSQQFKRSCLPDGPKVGSVSLSPRGDWRMPSDAEAALWLDEIRRLKEEG